MKKIFINAIVLIISCNLFAQTASKLENLGSKVNSVYYEVRPTISADGKLLYYIVEANPKNTRYKPGNESQDVWYSESGDDGVWGPAKQEKAPINTQVKNAVFWVSPDGNRIMIRGAFENGEYIGRGLSMCTKTAEGWSAPAKLNIKDYDKMSLGVYSGAVMGSDGKTLVLYFSTENNSEINDIYVSFLTGENEWSKPKSLGKTINNDEFDEISPFLAPDGVTLYFASDRPGGYGKQDIWMSKRLDDSWTNWTTPMNLGAPINTPDWDAYFTIDASGKYGYLASTQGSMGKTDLNRILLDEKDRPNAVVLMYGKVFNAKTKQPMTSKLLYDLLPGGENVGNALSSPIDGSYKLVLPYGKKYSLWATGDNFVSIADTMDLTIPGVYREVHRDLYLYPVDDASIVKSDDGKKDNRISLDSLDNLDDLSSVDDGQIVSLNNVLYDFNKAILRAKSFGELDKLIKILKKNPSVEIEMSAHTDNIGSDGYNIRLSEDRAYAVRQYLIAKGIDQSRVKSKGYGESKPIATNKTSDGRQLNRRVEFKIIKK